IENAKVTLESPVSAPVIKETASDGVVVFALVAPGKYKVTVEQTGFRRSVVDPVIVSITEVTNLQVTLEVGEVTTEVLVSGEAAPTVNTSNSTLGETLSGDVVGSLPLSTRNFLFWLGNNAGTSVSLPVATAAGRGATPTFFVAGKRVPATNLALYGIASSSLGT